MPNIQVDHNQKMNPAYLLKDRTGSLGTMFNYKIMWCYESSKLDMMNREKRETRGLKVAVMQDFNIYNFAKFGCTIGI